MSTKTVHEQRMDAIYRTQKHIYDVSRKYFLLGRDGLIHGLKPPRSGSVLEVGCGTGRNLLVAAGTYPDAKLFGLDISNEMLGTARRNLHRAGVAADLKKADACRFHADDVFEGRRFDRIFLSYALSMIPDWEIALTEACRTLAPGGSLHVVDFGQQERLPRWFRSALFGWLERFHVEPRGTLFDTIDHLAASGDRAAKSCSLYRGYAWQAVLTNDGRAAVSFAPQTH